MESFHKDITTADMPKNVRTRLNEAAKILKSYPNYDPSELATRLGRMTAAVHYRVTELALANHWSEYGREVRTQQVNTPWASDVAASKHENECTRRQAEQEAHEREAAYIVLAGTDGAVVQSTYKRWCADNPEIAKWVNHPRHNLCVRWIAAEIEAMGV